MTRQPLSASIRQQIQLQDRLARDASNPTVGRIHADLALLYREQLRRLVLA